MPCSASEVSKQHNVYTLLVKASQFGSLVLFSFKKTEGKTRPGDTQGDAQVPNHQQGFAVLSHMPHILASTHLELSHREALLSLKPLI